MWIENVSMAKIVNGDHYIDPQKTILIQIQDVGTPFVEPKYKSNFKAVYQFEFMDDEDPESEASISVAQGLQLAQILVDAYKNGDNIVVHCHAGLCRSGAVAEVGEMIDFDYAGSNKIPNLLVKRRVLWNRVMQDFLKVQFY